ncbi:hypothetical protein ACGFWE_40835 [Streptomyces sp. NPDC048523]|uniref:hypothetical protein n=1 Tax=Streptomyces sp. NPDC048523 TaxID=3365567 RepID=UPI00371AB325
MGVVVVRDTRLVQTAVIGDEQSDVPVVLPIEAIELDVFRRVHSHDTFWCGVLLGGCGAQLAHKLYVDRQCHFQHFPQANGAPHTCRRPRVGESSADHLYVKSAMTRTLLDHGRAGSFAFPPPIGSLLDVDLDDGLRLRVHMDGGVPPDWSGGRIPVLGPGVVPEPGVLSRCPYVYRVRCESEGASRQVWIGTQSLARPTEWVPLADCSWTEGGLITPAATEILRRRPTAIGSVPAGAPDRTGALPENVLHFIRGLEAAQRSGTVEHVRRLCAGSDPLLETLTGPARAEAQQALAEAREWLTGHEEYQQRVFADLEKAVSERRAWDVRSQLQTATTLTRRGASPAEQRVLAAARAFLRQQDHRPAAGAGRTIFYPPPPSHRPKRKRPDPQHEVPKPQAPRRQQSPKEKLEQHLVGARLERRERRAALQEVRSLLVYLRDAAGISVAEERRLIAQLTAAANAAGSSLSGSERRKAQVWIEKHPAPAKADSSRAQKETPNHATRRELPPAVLEYAAAAVRGALKKAAREQTTPSWDRLKQQLGSALPHMTLADRIQVLTLVDQTTPADQALLSSLVAAGDPDMTTAYRKVAAVLGLDLPSDDDDLRDVLDADVQQVHHHWRHH